MKKYDINPQYLFNEIIALLSIIFFVLIDRTEWAIMILVLCLLNILVSVAEDIWRLLPVAKDILYELRRIRNRNEHPTSRTSK